MIKRMKITRTKNTEAFDKVLQHLKPKKKTELYIFNEEFEKKHTVEVWTEQDEKNYTQLRRKHDRIYSKKRNDKTRVRRFSHKDTQK
jgi:hypothetical protein